MQDPHRSEENDEANEMVIESVAQQHMEKLDLMTCTDSKLQTPWVAVGFEPPVLLWRLILLSKPYESFRL